MSGVSIETGLADRGRVVQAYQEALYLGNWDQIVSLLNQPWAKTKQGERFAEEIRKQVLEEKERSERAQHELEDAIDKGDPYGLRWCNG